MKLLGILTGLLSLIASEEVYDYIVVGSGTGGGTVATELALKGFKTLLIEAGPDYFRVNQTVPVFHGKASEDPQISWDFDVKHYDNDETRYFYPRAGVLGGCSVHNAMITIYPNSRDFKLLMKLTGDKGWREDKMRGYFRRLERSQYSLNVTLPNVKKEHGYNGWFTTSYINYLNHLKLDSNLIDLVLATIGNPFLDVNGYTLDGGLTTDKEGNIFVPQAIDSRDYSRTNFPKYIKSVAKKTNLTIWTDTFVTKVLLDNQNAAYGVEFLRGKYLYKASPLTTKENSVNFGQVRASKEIVISGGTFNTPQLLMLSGIGDRDILSQFDIETKVHLPGVGRNMMDRYEIPIVTKYNKDFTLIKDCLFEETTDDPCYRDYLKHTGPYTSNAILSGELLKSHTKLAEPDLFILNILSDFHGYYRGYSNNVKTTKDTSTRLILKAHTSNTQGQVTLRSNNPFDIPDINFRSFSDSDEDLNILVKAIKQQRNFIKKRILVPYQEVFPGNHIKTDEQIREYIKQTAWGHHACCTAKLGEDSDPLAVLDSKFRVRNTQNLRVVDASAIPKIPGYFPAVYIHLMAMKAADDIAQS